MIENKKLKTILKNLPKSPGVYKMLDQEGRVIYLGKAKDLAKRVKQYFQKNYEHSSRTKKLLESSLLNKVKSQNSSKAVHSLNW